MGKLLPNGQFQLDTCDNYSNPNLLKYVHKEHARCQKLGCAIHAPSKHPLNQAPQDWSFDFNMMMRQCTCGHWHPDVDAMRFGIDTLNELKIKLTQGHRLSSTEQRLFERLEKDIPMSRKHPCCENSCCKVKKIKKRHQNPLSQLTNR